MTRWSTARHGVQGYADRRHAGGVLAERVQHLGLSDPLVLGLVRGGVPVAAEVARALGAPLRVCVSRKVGAPGQPELALGAVTAHGPATYDERMVAAFDVGEQWWRQACEREQAEAARRERVFGQDPAERWSGHEVVLVDDGLATGATARAAVRMVRQADPARVVLAVPVGSPEAVRQLQREADEVVCVLQPTSFTAVGQWYQSFPATSDEEIHRLLAAPQ
ncbi:phosphoribosyltransferase family protein [Salinifilum aidingensis]